MALSTVVATTPQAKPAPVAHGQVGGEGEMGTRSVHNVLSSGDVCGNGASLDHDKTARRFVMPIGAARRKSTRGTDNW
jgi:hypothetical protein